MAQSGSTVYTASDDEENYNDASSVTFSVTSNDQV